MTVIECIIGIFLALILELFWTRGIVNHFSSFALNRSAEKKRSKGQNFLEWLFYTRFRDVIPKKYLVWYYSLFVSFFVATISTIILHFLKVEDFIIRTPLGIYLWLYTGMVILQRILWHSFKDKHYHPEKTHIRKGRNKKRKRWYHK